MKKTIGCDLGSNTLRCVELVYKEKRYEKRVFERVVKTAWNLSQTGVVSDESEKRILQAFKEVKEVFECENLPKRCVATEALRKAKNSKEVLEKIRVQTGFICEVISPIEEARLSTKGVDFGLLQAKLPNEEYILIDFGGASTEFICKKYDKIISQSFPFGVISIANNVQKNRQIKYFLSHFLKQIGHFLQPYKDIQTLIGIAGTPTTVCAYKQRLGFEHYDANLISGKTLQVEDFKKALEDFSLMDIKTKEKWVGKGRSEVIEVAIVAFLELLRVCKKEKILVFDEGLAEGVALELL